MKKLKLFLAGMFVLLALAASAQVSVTVNVGSPPLWGPVGYTEVRYYYLPGVEAYYDIQSGMFIYYSGGVWIHRTSLPRRFRNYDLYTGYKVVMTDYHGSTPYLGFPDHKRMYSKSYHQDNQRTIGQKPEKGNSRSNGKPGKHK